MSLKFDDTLGAIGKSLMDTLSKIGKDGETPSLKAEMLFKYEELSF